MNAEWRNRGDVYGGSQSSMGLEPSTGLDAGAMLAGALAGCGKTLRSTQDSKRVDDKRRHIALPAPIALNKL